MEPKEGAAVGSPGSSSIKKGAGVGTGAGVAFEFFDDLLDFPATTGEGRVVLAPLVDLAAKTEAMERLPRKIIALVENFMMIFAERMNFVPIILCEGWAPTYLSTSFAQYTLLILNVVL